MAMPKLSSTISAGRYGCSRLRDRASGAANTRLNASSSKELPMTSRVTEEQ